MTRAGRQLLVESLLVTSVVVALFVGLAALLWGCGTSGEYVAPEILSRSPAVCEVHPADGMGPCTITLLTDDDRIIASVRSLTGCVVRTRMLERVPGLGTF